MLSGYYVYNALHLETQSLDADASWSNKAINDCTVSIVTRATRVCTHCGAVAVADKLHMILECPAPHTLKQQCAPSCTGRSYALQACTPHGVERIRQIANANIEIFSDDNWINSAILSNFQQTILIQLPNGDTTIQCDTTLQCTNTQCLERIWVSWKTLYSAQNSCHPPYTLCCQLSSRSSRQAFQQYTAACLVEFTLHLDTL